MFEFQRCPSSDNLTRWLTPTPNPPLKGEEEAEISDFPRQRYLVSKQLCGILTSPSPLKGGLGVGVNNRTEFGRLFASKIVFRAKRVTK